MEQVLFLSVSKLLLFIALTFISSLWIKKCVVEFRKDRSILAPIIFSFNNFYFIGAALAWGVMLDLVILNPSEAPKVFTSALLNYLFATTIGGLFFYLLKQEQQTT